MATVYMCKLIYDMLCKTISQLTFDFNIVKNVGWFYTKSIFDFNIVMNIGNIDIGYFTLVINKIVIK